MLELPVLGLLNSDRDLRPQLPGSQTIGSSGDYSICFPGPPACRGRVMGCLRPPESPEPVLHGINIYVCLSIRLSVCLSIWCPVGSVPLENPGCPVIQQMTEPDLNPHSCDLGAEALSYYCLKTRSLSPRLLPFGLGDQVNKQ